LRFTVIPMSYDMTMGCLKGIEPLPCGPESAARLLGQADHLPVDPVDGLASVVTPAQWLSAVVVKACSA
jgi:hypothetical protein